MIEQMTTAQFENYRKLMAENCPDFQHCCNGEPLRAGGQKISPCAHYVRGICTQPQLSEYREMVRVAANRRREARRKTKK